MGNQNTVALETQQGPLPPTLDQQDVQPIKRGNMSNRTDECVMLATQHGDLGVVPTRAALKLAREQADGLGLPVYLRHPITDRVIRVITPHQGLNQRTHGAPWGSQGRFHSAGKTPRASKNLGKTSPL